ncbi:MAG: hypothetical protein ACK40X_10885 [Armatimonadota bacterium]
MSENLVALIRWRLLPLLRSPLSACPYPYYYRSGAEPVPDRTPMFA